MPVFDFTRALAEEGLVPGGSKRNLEYVASAAHFDDAVSDVDRLILADAQTSGGLLLAVPPENEATLLADLRARGTGAQATIGEIQKGQPGSMEVVPT